MLYRFNIDILAPPPVVTDRIRAVVREEAGFWKHFRVMWQPRDPLSPPFVGCVRDSSFKIRRDIRYRNSFIPSISGEIVPTPAGSRVNVTMFMHPAVTIFVVAFLASAGYGVFNDPSATFAPAFMFVFMLVLAGGSFVDEVVKAKRLLSAAILRSAITSPTQPVS